MKPINDDSDGSIIELFPKDYTPETKKRIEFQDNIISEICNVIRKYETELTPVELSGIFEWLKTSVTNAYHPPPMYDED